jgi:hypothetical protein
MRKTKTKTKRLRKISKFTNKNRLAGMIAESTILDNAIIRLKNLASLIVSGKGGSIKVGILEIIGMFEELNIQDQIEFIQTLNTLFLRYHTEYPVPTELYFMQIITLIDSTIGIPIDFESMQLAKLSNDSMRMMATAFRGREIVIPTILTIEETIQH